jgi:Uncharacterized protein conserved in bacteria (DUF2252)
VTDATPRSTAGSAADSPSRRPPRRTLAELDTSARDPLGVLGAQDASRLPDLVPIRYGRMLASPLAFYRGAEAVMAADLARSPATELAVQLAGDAHLLNFGGFASPERSLVFDVNDFDETRSGPFEWDVKRLATSIELAARQRGFAGADAARGTVRAYREALRSFAQLGELDVWYARLDVEALLNSLEAQHDPKLRRELRRTIDKARRNDGRRALKTLTHVVDGEPRIVSEPPLIVPGLDLRDALEEYRDSLAPDRRALYDRFRYVDGARKVVGVGSVGTHCSIALLLGKQGDDPLFLQFKESAEPRAVVEGQRLVQAVSDIFLGWTGDAYVRQLRDWKVTIDVDAILPRGLAEYGQACAWTLARAHSRSGDRAAIAAYLGPGDRFDDAVARFAVAYADLTEQDHAELERAVADGRIEAQTGI